MQSVPFGRVLRPNSAKCWKSHYSGTFLPSKHLFIGILKFFIALVLFCLMSYLLTNKIGNDINRCSVNFGKYHWIALLMVLWHIFVGPICKFAKYLSIPGLLEHPLYNVFNVFIKSHIVKCSYYEVYLSLCLIYLFFLSLFIFLIILSLFLMLISFICIQGVDKMSDILLLENQ